MQSSPFERILEQALARNRVDVRAKLIFGVFLAAIIPAFLAAAISYRRNAEEKKCVIQMQLLWDCARSWHLEQILSPDTLITQSDLTGFIGQTNLHCPLGPKPYEAFTFRNGPKCPYSESHNKRLGGAPELYQAIVDREDRERKGK